MADVEFGEAVEVEGASLDGAGVGESVIVAGARRVKSRRSPVRVT